MHRRSSGRTVTACPSRRSMNGGKNFQAPFGGSIDHGVRATPVEMPFRWFDLVPVDPDANPRYAQFVYTVGDMVRFQICNDSKACFCRRRKRKTGYQEKYDGQYFSKVPHHLHNLNLPALPGRGKFASPVYFFWIRSF